MQASSDGVTWTTVFESHGTGTAWVQRTVDLSAFAGGDVYLRFWFDTIDGLINNFEGWYVDDVSVRAAGSAPAPTVSGVDPPDGLAVGGTPVTITGADFVAGATVTFGGAAATTVSVDDPGTITADTPAHAAGPVDVVVTNPDLQGDTLPDGYTYLAPDPAPTVSGVDPPDGLAVGGTPVTITGADFVAGATVTFGGAAATTVSVDDPGTITADTPAHAAGPVDVVVTNPDLQGDTLPDGYTYLAPASASTILYFSLGSNGAVDGLSVANEDIVAFDGTSFTLHFDGSDVGLSGFTLDAFDVIGPTEILMSFTGAGSVPGISGTVDDSDLVQFTATGLGAETSGSFELYFDGSDVGLTSGSEDVDASRLLEDGRLLLSTRGSFGVSGVSGRDEDLLAFTPSSLGANMAGSWSLYFDGSDVGMSSSSEDINALGLDGDGTIYLSTTGTLSVSGLSSADEDVVVFTPASLGSSTSGSFSSAVFFDGSAYGLSSNDLFAIDIPTGPANGVPVADDQGVTTLEDAAVPVTLTGSDPDGDPMTYQVATDPAHGSLSGAAPDLTYVPSADFNGADSFTFTVNDGTADSDPATVTIAITAANDAPEADDQAVTAKESTDLEITLTASDVDGDALTFNVLSDPAHGALSGTAPDLTYTPDVGYTGGDSFTFDASDGDAGSNVATVSITVAPNSAPSADDQSVPTAEDTPAAITLTGSDVDGDPLTFSVTADPVNGTLDGTPPDLTYTPAADFHGSDSLTFTVNDGTVDSEPATVSISVTAVNDPPVANLQAVTTDEDTPVAITLTGSDVDGDSLTFNITAAPVNGTLDGTSPDLTYTPDSDFHGSDGFTYEADDGTATSVPAAVTITVTSVNDPPLADFTLSCTNLSCGFTDTSTDDGTVASHSWDFGDGATSTAQNPSHDYGDEGTYSVTLTVTDNDGTSDSVSQNVAVSEAPAGPQLRVGIVTAETDAWTTVTLDRSYSSMVVVAIPNYDSSSPPMVPRIRNASGTSFEVKLDRVDGETGAVSAAVHYMVVEEGVYTLAEHGVTLEAVKFESTVTDRRGSWSGEARSYANSYSAPVVVGQVMSYNDPDWSVFWSRSGSSRSTPPNSTLRVGKHVAEDPDTTRAAEIIGYIVIETGSGTIGGIAYSAALGSDSIRGVGDSPPYSYSISLAGADTAVASQAAMDGGNGGWAILSGAAPLSSSDLRLAIDEDQLNDEERRHTSEQVAYLVFDAVP